MLARARAKAGPRADWVGGDVTLLPFSDASFHGVVSTSSLHYWPDPPGALAEIRRVLRRGGWLVVTDWCHDFLACRMLDALLRLVDRAHGRVLGTEACERLLRTGGFSDVRVERYRVGIFWGLMTARARKAE